MFLHSRRQILMSSICLMISSPCLSAALDLYDQPSHSATVIAHIDTADGINIITVQNDPQTGSWIKITDTKYSKTGWIDGEALANMLSTNNNAPTNNIISTGKQPESWPLQAGASVQLSTEQAKELLDKMQSQAAQQAAQAAANNTSNNNPPTSMPIIVPIERN